MCDKAEKKAITDLINNSTYLLNELSNDKKFFAGVEERESRIDIWKYDKGEYKYLQTLDKHCGIVKVITFNNKATLLFSGSFTHEIKVWELSKNKFKVSQTLESHKEPLKKLKVCSQDKYLFSLYKDNFLIIWERRIKKLNYTKKKKKFLRYCKYQIIKKLNYKKKKKKFLRYCKYQIIKNFPYDIDNIIISQNQKFIQIKAFNNKINIFDLEKKEFINESKIRALLLKPKLQKLLLVLRLIELSKEQQVKKNKQLRNKKKDIIKKKNKTNKSETYKIKINKTITLDKFNKRILKEINKFRKNINIKDSSKTIKTSNKSPIIRKSTGVITVNVGLDFGTSATKIAYRRGANGRVCPLLFDHKLPKYENYFIPTVVTFDDQNKLLLGLQAAEYLQNNKNSRGINNFKVLFVYGKGKNYKNSSLQNIYEKNKEHFIKKGIKIRYEEIIVSFIAYVMRISKNKIVGELSNLVLDFSFNICLPVDYINNNTIFERFKKIIAAAEFIERTDYSKSKDVEYIRKILRIIRYDSKRTRVFAIPETVAEVASYTSSAAVREGLHEIIDFGAGTTDVSFINIKKPRRKDQEISFYASEVLPYGFREINEITGKQQRIKKIKYLRKVFDKTSRIWSEAYKHYQKTDFWESVLILISGGGAESELVPNIFSQSQAWQDCYKIKHNLQKLPIPENYTKVEQKIPFHRFAVAYGLTIPKPKLDLKKYTLPKDATDDTPTDIYVPRRDNDERIPNKNWLRK